MAQGQSIELSRQLIRAVKQKDIETFNTHSKNIHYADLASVYEDLDDNDRHFFSETMPAEQFADVLAELPDTLIEEALESYSEEDQREILDTVSDDDRVDILQDVSDDARKKYIDLLDEDDKAVTNTLLRYDEETYIGMTVKDAIDLLREHSEDTQTLTRIFVIDESDRLVGKLRFRDLTFNPWDTPISDLATPVERTILASHDQEEAVQMFLKYDMILLPVIDEQDRLLGVITHDDAMEIFEEESTEDIEKMAGVAGEHSEESYLNTSVLQHFKRRFPWLFILALLAITSGYVMLRFEHILNQAYILALYLPMVVAAGGNTGGQAATMVIRAMALGELETGTSIRVALKEGALGLILGSTLGMLIAIITFFILPLFSPEMPTGIGYGLFAITVAIALTVQITTSTLTGALLPIFAKKANIDPAVVASPAITTIVDVTGMVIYFLAANAIMQF